MLNKFLSTLILLVSMALLPQMANASEKKALAHMAESQILNCRQSLEKDGYQDFKLYELFDKLTESWQEAYVDEKSNFELPTLLNALAFAAHQHKGQTRPDKTTPLLHHILGTTYLLWHEGEVRSVNVIVTSLLHHTLKDSQTSLDQIEETFGPCVRRTIVELGPKESHAQLDVDRYSQLSLNAQLIKLASRLETLHFYRHSEEAAIQEKLQQHLEFAPKFLKVFRGVNKHLEKAFAKEIKKF